MSITIKRKRQIEVILSHGYLSDRTVCIKRFCELREGGEVLAKI